MTPSVRFYCAKRRKECIRVVDAAVLHPEPYRHGPHARASVPPGAGVEIGQRLRLAARPFGYTRGFGSPRQAGVENQPVAYNPRNRPAPASCCQASQAEFALMLIATVGVTVAAGRADHAHAVGQSCNQGYRRSDCLVGGGERALLWSRHWCRSFQERWRSCFTGRAIQVGHSAAGRSSRSTRSPKPCLDPPGLALHAEHRLYENGTHIGRRVGENHNAKPVALSPNDIRSVRHIRPRWF